VKGQRCPVGTPYISGEVKKEPLTYGHKGGEAWSRTTTTKKSMVPLVLSKGPNIYPNIDTYPPIHRPVEMSRSISNVDANSTAGEYGRNRRSMPIRTKSFWIIEGVEHGNQEGPV